MITAEILTIGDELTRGEIVDTNSSWLAERLTALGAYVRWRSSVTDDAADVKAALTTAAARARVVVTSGGLGPTDDDRTVDVVAALLGVGIVEDEAHLEKMKRAYAARGFTLTPNNLRQVRVPAGAVALANEKGAAPGFSVAVGAATLFCMPGVPREMMAIFDGAVAPAVSALVGKGAPQRRTWRIAGKGESHVDHALAGLMNGIADATLHFRIAYPENLVTAVVRRDDPAEAARVIERLDAEVRVRLGDHVYGVGDTTLPAAVGERLLAQEATLAVAESCTGGLIGELLTTVPGSSRWFVGGVIAYSNTLKRDLLDVDAETLAAHGAVSSETVLAMADGARRRTGADLAIAVSGIAGPDGGTPEKPVGTVFIAVTGAELRQVRKLFWPTERTMVQKLAAHAALHLLWKLIGKP